MRTRRLPFWYALHPSIRRLRPLTLLWYALDPVYQGHPYARRRGTTLRCYGTLGACGWRGAVYQGRPCALGCAPKGLQRLPPKSPQPSYARFARRCVCQEFQKDWRGGLRDPLAAYCLASRGALRD